jgi:uncharacterized protein (UPF0303 family)
MNFSGLETADPKALRAELLRQENALLFKRFDNGTAIALGMRMMESAQAQALPLTIDITRCQQQLFHVALDGTVKDNDDWVRRKREMVYRMGHSSWFAAVESRLNGEGLFTDCGLDPASFSGEGGGFPIFVRDVGLVGTATASGLASAEDHKFIVAELAKFLGVTL